MTFPMLADVLAAKQAIRGIAIETPLVPSPALSAGAGCEVLLKLETMQPVGAFKIRGAANAMAHLPPESRKRGVACCSTGNHGRGVAYAARHFGVRAIVCLSKLVPDVKVDAIKALGAEVRRIGDSQDDAQVEVDRLVASEGMTDLHPFDHPHVIAGQGTIGLEILTERPDTETIVVPLSGGGLFAGIALAAKAIKPSIRMIGVSMARGAAMIESLEAGKPVEVVELPTLADSLGGGIGLANRWTFALCRQLADHTLTLSETEIYRGMRALFLEDRLVTEGGGAVGAAALIAGRLALEGPTALVVSGRNVDMTKFLSIARGEPVTIGDMIVSI
ncbi:MAG: hydroxyectoine utilization dehydratase EutB [Hyphomicrobiaceae bacterium]